MKAISTIVSFIVIILSLAVGALAGYYVRKLVAESRIGAAEEEADRIVEEAIKEAEARKKEFDLNGKRWNP